MKRKKERFIKYILICLLLIISLSVGYASFATYLTINGEVIANSSGYIIDPDSNPNLTISNMSINKWQSGNKYKYQYSFYVNNLGTENLDNFTAQLFYNAQIIALTTWNYTYEINNQNITIINTQNDLNANGSILVTFILETREENLNLIKIKLQTNTTPSEIDPSLFLVNFKISNSWDTYTYQYNVELTNKTGAAINFWQISITLPVGTYYVTGWDAIFETYGNELVIKNTSYNGRMNKNQRITIGLQLQTNQINYKPTTYRISVR